MILLYCKKNINDMVCKSSDKMTKIEDLEIPKEILNILDERKKARESKDWNKSDVLRDKIKELGYVVKDTKEGQVIEKV